MDVRSCLENEFLRASDKIKQIELSDFLPRRIILEDHDELYTHIRRSGRGLCSKNQRCHKWTQTSTKSNITIDGFQCWQQGTLSHSLLQVSGVFFGARRNNICSLSFGGTSYYTIWRFYFTAYTVFQATFLYKCVILRVTRLKVQVKL